MTSRTVALVTSVVLIMLAWLKSVSGIFGNEAIFVASVLGILVIFTATFRWVWVYLHSRHYRSHPFRMWYENPVGDGRLLGGELIISSGSANVFLRIKTARKTSYEKIRMSLIPLGSGTSSVFDVARINSIHVRNILVEQLKEGLDSSGAYVCFDPPCVRLPEDELHLVVGIKSKEQWVGDIVFQSERSDGHLGGARVRLSIK